MRLLRNRRHAPLMILVCLSAFAAGSEDQAIAKGAQVFADQCWRCHEIPDPATRGARAWRAVSLHMRTFACLSREEQQQLLAFLRYRNLAKDSAMVPGNRSGEASAAQAGSLPSAPAPATSGLLLEEWVVPAEATSVKNPVASTPDSISRGQSVFQQNCVICHGATGEGDGVAAPSLNPKPAKLTDPKVQQQSDGILFWKLSKGRALMIGWGAILSEQDRWSVVNYLRSLVAK